MDNFFSEKGFTNFLKRLNNLQPDSNALWGIMNTSQMMLHLSLAIGSGLDKDLLPDESTTISRTVIKKGILYIIPRFPKNAKTAKSLRIKDAVEFHSAKDNLLEVLNRAYATNGNIEWHPHPLLGKMSRKEWGVLITKHLDHHLRQFGV